MKKKNNKSEKHFFLFRIFLHLCIIFILFFGLLRSFEALVFLGFISVIGYLFDIKTSVDDNLRR